MTIARNQDLKCSREQQPRSLSYASEIKEGMQGRLQESGRKQAGIGLQDYALS